MCSLQASGGHSRGEGLVACAMTASRLGARCMGAMRPALLPGRPAGAPFSLDEALEVARRAALVWDAILAHLCIHAKRLFSSQPASWLPHAFLLRLLATAQSHEGSWHVDSSLCPVGEATGALG